MCRCSTILQCEFLDTPHLKRGFAGSNFSLGCSHTNQMDTQGQQPRQEHESHATGSGSKGLVMAKALSGQMSTWGGRFTPYQVSLEAQGTGEQAGGGGCRELQLTMVSSNHFMVVK